VHKKEGWLLRHKPSSNPERNWVVVSDGQLKYYRAKEDTKKAGMIELILVSKVVKVKGEKGADAIEITSPSRVYVFSPDEKDPTLVDDWVNALNSHIKWTKEQIPKSKDKNKRKSRVLSLRKKEK